MLQAQFKKTANNFLLNVEFSVQKGITGIVGPSGSGKSLTLKALAGFVELDEGYIVQEDQIFFDKKKKLFLKTRFRNIGYVFQDYALFPHLTVQQNIEYGLESLPQNKRKELSQSYIEKMQLGGLEHLYPNELSGGQQQRTALARTLVTKPKLLLLDEPFSALDPSLREALATKLITLVKEHFDGVTLFVTHHLEDAYRLCDTLLVYHNGEIIEHGKTKELFRSPRKVETAKWLGIENIFPVSKFPYQSEQTLDANYWAIRAQDISLAGPDHLNKPYYFLAELIGHTEKINAMQLMLRYGHLNYLVEVEKELAAPILTMEQPPILYLNPDKILMLT